MPDRRVLITAGASGIGRAMAQLFGDAGWSVWVTDVDPDALARCPAEWRVDCVDVSDVGAMADLFARVSRDWGGLETLCANAGIAGQTALIEDQDIPTFRQCLEVNLIGSVLAVQGALPIMKAAGGGDASYSPDRHLAVSARRGARLMSRRNGRSTV